MILSIAQTVLQEISLVTGFTVIFKNSREVSIYLRTKYGITKNSQSKFSFKLNIINDLAKVFFKNLFIK